MTKPQTSQVNYTGPFITMVFLMAIIGFLTVLNGQFQAPLQNAFLLEAGDMKNALATMCTFVFFLAYLLMGGTSARMVDNKGYRKTLVNALLILVVGLGLFELAAWQFDSTSVMKTFEVEQEAVKLGFWQSLPQLFSIDASGAMAHAASSVQMVTVERAVSTTTISMFGATIPYAFFIFLIGSFVAGTAMTFLQVVVNPYLVACNVKGTSGVQRQTIAGAANSTMSTLAPLFVAYVIFAGQTDIQISSLYIPFGVLMVVIAIISFALTKVNLPEIVGTTATKGEVLPKSVWSFSHLSLGVIAIFFYVGVEVAIGSNIVMWAKDLPNFAETAAIMATLYFAGMLIGRLCGSFISKVPANIQLLVTAIGATILVTASMFTLDPRLMMFVGLFHSVMWPSIFALALEGLGRYTAKGSGALMLGVVGGAVLPLLQGVLADILGGWNWTWTIVIVAELFLLYYALIGHKVRTSDVKTETY